MISSIPLYFLCFNCTAPSDQSQSGSTAPSDLESVPSLITPEEAIKRRLLLEFDDL